MTAPTTTTKTPKNSTKTDRWAELGQDDSLGQWLDAIGHQWKGNGGLKVGR